MSNLNETKRQTLQDDQLLKLKEYEAVATTLRNTLNPGDRPKLESQLKALEADIQRIETELRALGEAQAVTPVPAVIETHPPARKIFFMVDALPSDFVPRPNEFEPIVQSLVGSAQDTVAITAALALKGAGGYGKTTLARAVCHDPRVRRKFADGVLWVTLGEKISEADLITKVLDLIEVVIDKRPTVVTLEAAKNELKEAVGSRALLLVVDDVWHPGHTLPFLDLGPNTALLITTRNSGTLPSQAVPHNVDAMQISEAVQLLGRGLAEASTQTAALKRLAARLGEWPLLLKLANRQLVDFQAMGLGDALALVNELLDAQGFETFNDPNDRESRNRAAAASLEVSIGLLDEAQREKFMRLAIFPEDADVPLTTLEKLWGINGAQVIVLCQRLNSLSLLLRFDLKERFIRLHDVVRTYLRDTHKAALRQWQADLVEALGDLRALPDAYAWRNIAYHLREANQIDILRGLLLDLSFLQAKLNATDANALLADFVGLTDDEPLRLVESALSMSVHVISEDKNTLALQLYGRLMRHQDKQPDLSSLIQVASERQGYLRLLHPTLSQAGGALIRTIPLDNWGWAITLTDDGNHLIVADGHTVKIFIWRMGTLLTNFVQHTEMVRGVSVQGELAFSASDDHTVKVWRWATGELLTNFTQHTQPVASVAVQGELAFSASSDKTVKVWRWATGELLTNFTQHTQPVASVAVQSELAFSASDDDTVKVWRWATGELLTNFMQHEGSVTSVAVQGELAFSASEDRTVKVWHWATGELLTNFTQHLDRVNIVSVQGELVFSASDDQTVKVWHGATGKLLTAFTQHTNGVSVQGEFVFSVSIDQVVKVWRWASSETLPSFAQHTNIVTSVAIQGEMAFSASEDKTVKVWRWETGELLTDFKQHARSVTGVSVQGELAFSSSDDQTVKVWRWRTGELLTNFAQPKEVNGVAVQGDLAFSASWDKTVKVWRWATGELLTNFTQHTRSVTGVAVQGDLAFSTSEDETVKVWRWATGEVLTDFTQHTAYVYGVAIQGDLAFSASWDKTVKVWRWATGEVLNNFTQHTHMLVGVSVQGELAFSTSIDGTVKIWRWTIGEVIAVFTADAPLMCLAFDQTQRILLLGDIQGHVHVLRVVGLDHLLFPDGEDA